MEFAIVRRYIHDAYQAYQDCLIANGIGFSVGNLSALGHAGRNRQIAKRGLCSGANGSRWEYNIHGSGYSFRDSASGKDIRFDVHVVEGQEHLRFAAWEVFKYMESVGEAVAEQVVQLGLRKFSEEGLIVRVEDGAFEYYYDLRL